MTKLSHAEQEAMDRLKGTCIPIDSVPLKNEKDFVYGTVIPGLNVYKKLEKKGLVIITEDEEGNPEFIELTVEGLKLK